MTSMKLLSFTAIFTLLSFSYALPVFIGFSESVKSVDTGEGTFTAEVKVLNGTLNKTIHIEAVTKDGSAKGMRNGSYLIIYPCLILLQPTWTTNP